MGTGTVSLATGVVPIYTRTPSLMAQCTATLQDVSGGRFTLGVGVSSKTVVERWNSVPYDQPLPRIKEYVELVRRLLAWEKPDHAGLYDVHGYQRCSTTLTALADHHRCPQRGACCEREGR